MQIKRWAVVASVVLGGCASATPVGIRPGDPIVRGPVETIDHRATASGILVSAGPGSAEPCGIQATVDQSTAFFSRRGDVVEVAAIADLAVGDTVEVYVDGAVAESCPVQGYADQIVIIAPRAIP